MIWPCIAVAPFVGESGDDTHFHVPGSSEWGLCILGLFVSVSVHLSPKFNIARNFLVYMRYSVHIFCMYSIG